MGSEMKLPRIGFAKRVLVLYGIVFVLVLLITDWTLSQTFANRDLAQLKGALTRQALLVGEIAAPIFERKSELQALVTKIAKKTESRVTIIDAEGIVLADSSESASDVEKMDNHATRPEVAAALKQITGSVIRYSMTLKTQMLYVAVPIFDGKRVSGVVRVAMPITRVDEFLASARKPIFFWAFIGVLIVLFAGILFASRLTERIRKITRVAERYSQEDWSEKIMLDGRDELQFLANTMNRMADTLKARILDLETEKGKISAILTNMTEAVIAIDRHRQIVTANPNAENLFGFKLDAAVGKSLIEIVKHPRLEMIVDRAIREQKTVTDEIQLSLKKKNILRVSSVMLGQSAQNIRGILVFYDITELRRLENIRKEFVANASHELRTPLTSIKGFIETLLDGAMRDPTASERFLKIMQEDATRLGRLVDDILTLGEIEQGSVPLKKELLDLSEETRNVVERFRNQINTKKISVETDLPSEKITVTADRDKVRQVFVNLIDNAIKFNKEGGKIILTARQNPQGIQISVEDTGVGIPQEAIHRIFERFFRVDKARSRELGGTGLGLAIVKHIMEAHGGRVSCESILGSGTRFSVLFPL